MKWVLILGFVLQTLQLSLNGTLEIKIGIHVSETSADIIHAAYTRVYQFNNISNLIHPRARLKLYFLPYPSTDAAAIKSEFGYITNNTAAVVGAGTSARSALLSRVLQNAKIPQW